MVTYGGVSLSVTASWDPDQMTITCGQRNVRSDPDVLCNVCMLQTNYVVQFNFPGTAGISTAIADLQVIWNTPSNIDYTIDEPSTNIQRM